MRKLLYIFLSSIFLFTSFHSFLNAQVTVSNGHNIIEITGAISTYYNHRILKEGELRQHKNRFKLRDAQFQLEGRYKNLFAYELQMDFADILGGGNTIDPENPGLMDAFVTYRGLPVDITLGYGKLPYSRSSMVPFIYSPYWQRAELVRGELFSRRDVGLTLKYGFWRQLINIYAGVYTGLGELSLQGDNDASGQPEYVGRIDFAYPSRYRYRDIDTRITPIPMFAVGFSGRYANKTQPEGFNLPAFSAGEYGLKVLDGEKRVLGFDFTAQYKGLSVQFEIHQALLRPANEGSFLFRGLDDDLHGGYVMAGGYLAQVNYFLKPARSIFSARYEELNLNDLEPGLSRRIHFAYAYQINGYNAMLKAQYFKILEEEEGIDRFRWTDQFRIGIQYLFR